MDTQTSVRLAVGCYSQPIGHAPDAHGKGVQILELDLGSREARTAFEYGAIANPAFLQPHPTLPVLYVVSELWASAPGTVNSLRFTEGWTELVSRSELPTGGHIPSYVSVAGDFLLLSNYGDGSLCLVPAEPCWRPAGAGIDGPAQWQRSAARPSGRTSRPLPASPPVQRFSLRSLISAPTSSCG